jgi:hypothetical protein
MHKPADEYYLHDHGDGNGWQIASRGPSRFGVITTSQVNERKGVIEVIVEQYIHGALSTNDTSVFMLAPEEAQHLGEQLLQAAQEGEGSAVTAREQQLSQHATE